MAQTELLFKLDVYFQNYGHFNQITYISKNNAIVMLNYVKKKKPNF